MKKIDRINLDLIINGCQEGNRKSQNKLYQYFYGYGLHICLRYGQTREEAVEILNDGFLKVFQRLDSYDKQRPFKPWLRKILIHTAIDHHRKFNHREIYLEQSEIEQYSSVSPEDIEEFEDLLPFVQALPPAYRMVFNLYVMEGLKHQEIADHLDISPGTSKSNLARAKNRLKVMILERKNNSRKFNINRS